MSSAEAEYVSLSACCAQVLWLRTQLTDYGFYFDKIPMYCDSKAAIAISYNPVQHSRTKHIDVRYHFIKKQVEKGIVELFFIGIEYQLADLFTKALSEDRFKYLVKRLGMRCLTPEELEVLANESARSIKQRTKPMFNDSDFDVLDDAMENVEGGSTAGQITTAGDTLNIASINVSTVRPLNVSAAGPSISTAGDIFEDEMTTIADTLVAIRSSRPRTTSVEEEREQFSIDEQARFLVEKIAERKRFFASQRAEQIRNKPPTIAQLRNKMVTFMKHMESSKKRPRADLDDKSAKKQKLEENDAEKEELRACLDIVSGDEIAMDFESLDTKYPIIV
ncbi:hypothetical protein Tco_0104469 [Tanacetum coccineum]